MAPPLFSSVPTSSSCRIGRPHANLDSTRPAHRARTSQFLDVEEGTFDNGRWVMERRWNGDQIDYGLNLTRPRC